MGVHMTDIDRQERWLIVSRDSHVDRGSRDLRPYCPKKYLEAFDDDVTDSARRPGSGPRRSTRCSIPSGSG